MSEFAPFEHELAQTWGPDLWQDVTSVVAVSGGADSVALLRGLQAIRCGGSGRLVVAHFNHGLRGGEADDDAEFVARLCHDLGLECQLGRVDPAAWNSPDAASEQAARDLRYDFLRRVTSERGARYLVTAHTADDQAETILHRLIRGTGIAGLSGIPTFRQFLPGVSLVRPMLAVRRCEVIEYLEFLGQPFRTDSSNCDIRFTRNRIRLKLLPELTTHYNPSVVAALARLGSLAAEAQEVIDQVVDDLRGQCISSQSTDSVTIACNPLRASHHYLVRSVLISVWQQQNWPLQEMGFERWEELAEMAVSPLREVPKRVFPGNISAERRGETLVLLAG